jgi:1-acyl-sn-glycerol-3-phosphate acyltransferase
MTQNPARIEILKRIEEFEKEKKFDIDVENDPPGLELLPNKVDYLNKKLSSKIATKIANRMAYKFFEKMIKNHQLIIKNVVGIDNYLSVQGGAILTCNHFNPCDNYAIDRTLQPYLGKKRLYKVIKEGNYTNFPGPLGFFFRHCNTLPLSRNSETLKNFIFAINTLLKRGENILIYPEQAMWWNYRKPRPLKSGAFRFAVGAEVPVVPIFITMEDSEYIDGDGFPVQAYTIHLLPAIYPKTQLTKKENIEYLKNENYRLWVETYENFYNKKLEY